jgi:Ca2+:H+ antiporter
LNKELPIKRTVFSLLYKELSLIASMVTAILFFLFGDTWLADLSNPAWFTVMTLWLFGAILFSAFSIVRHAESLAVILGEPVGTLVLTLAVIGIEVMMISAVMLTGDSKPALARDTMFGVVMTLLNGMTGVSILLGGLRHHEQTYNLQGANAFLALIMPLAVLGLVLPNFTTTTSGPTLSPFQSIFSAVMSVGIYGIFLAVQTSRHRDYFISPDSKNVAASPNEHEVISPLYHAALLILYILPLVILAKELAVPLEYSVQVFNAPKALSGFLVALLILSPEAMSAVRAALRNELQRSVNILLGSVLATIGLTIPAVLTIGLITGKTVYLGLGATDMVLLILTLTVSTLTFSNNRTNILLGAVHLLMFLAYLMLMFET